MGSDGESAAQNAHELFKTIIGTAGIMLPLLWGLTQRTLPMELIFIIRLASAILVVSIISSVLGCQFMVTELERGSRAITKQKRVAFSFLAGWLSFLIACILVILAIFQVK